MKKQIVTVIACSLVTLFAGSTSFAEDAAVATSSPTQTFHENKKPINHAAAKGMKADKEAVQEGDLTPEQGHALKHEHQKIENAEQKNADLRHGLVSKGDHAKFTRKAKKVNQERNETIDKNVEAKENEEMNTEKKE
jgi:nitrogen fixation protein FixH